MKSVLSALPVVLLVALGSCPPNPPQPPIPPVPTTDTIGVRVIQAETLTPIAGAAVTIGATAGTTDGTGLAELVVRVPERYLVGVTADGFFAYEDPYDLGFGSPDLPIALRPRPPPGPPGRTGPVRLEGRAYADDQGTWNALGASLFWALWGEANDPDRLDRNLATLRAAGVDFVRILGMVGTESWADRRIDPRSPTYWAIVEAFLDRLGRHGLRAQVTLFADAQVMWPDVATRPAFVSQWGDVIARRRDRIQLAEIANEHWQNGVASAELGQLAATLRGRVGATLPLALSSTEPNGWCGAYGNVPSATVTTLHYDREIGFADGPWRPVRQPWGYPSEYEVGCRLPLAAQNNEPIGPKSSGAEENDPTRLALAYAATVVAGNAGYVFHAGAGIRGGGQADLARGRKANYFEEDPNVLAALGRVRSWLPNGLAGWTRQNAQWTGFPFSGAADAVDRGDVVRWYVTQRGSHTIGVILGVRRPFTVTARGAGTWTLRDATTTEVVTSATLAPGQSWTIPTDRTGYLVEGLP